MEKPPITLKIPPTVKKKSVFYDWSIPTFTIFLVLILLCTILSLLTISLYNERNELAEYTKESNNFAYSLLVCEDTYSKCVQACGQMELCVKQQYCQETCYFNFTTCSRKNTGNFLAKVREEDRSFP